jgi:V/A-type H+-transporting ATPase subunit I
MKKVSLVTMNSEKREALEKLRSLGVVHLRLGNKTSDDLDTLLEKKNFIERVLSLLPPEQADPQAEQLGEDETYTIGEEALELNDEIRELRDRIEKLQRELDRISAWGEFNPEDIRALADQNVHIKLYSIYKEDLEELSSIAETFVISEDKNRALVAAVFLRQEDIPERAEFQLPERSREELGQQIHEHRQKIEEKQKRLEEIAAYRSSFEKSMTRLDNFIEFERAHANMGEESSLAYLNGFVPENRIDILKKGSAENGWGLLIEEPAKDDPVPTLVENPKWIRIINPVFNMMGTVPGYREFDISGFFLVFLSIFFAMIVGDGGYGIIFLLLPLVMFFKKRKAGEEIPLIIPMLMVMAITTIVWGAITGTWFGHEEFADGTFLSALVIDRIDTFNPRSSETVKKICFIIGTVQIALAHFWNFLSELQKRPRIRAFAQMGWFVTVLGLFYLVLNIVLSSEKYPMPDFALYMILAGLVTVILFSQQEGNFFKGIIKGIGGFITTFLDSISAFSDIISYIRLFAVGLATVEIAKSFNQMAAGAGDGVVGIIGGILILLLGHTLNLAMASLSVVVHGVRLNMLEFSGHLGMEWTGIAYKPFQETEKEE